MKYFTDLESMKCDQISKEQRKTRVKQIFSKNLRKVRIAKLVPGFMLLWVHECVTVRKDSKNITCASERKSA